jgi:hypothetical protein
MRRNHRIVLLLAVVLVVIVLVLGSAVELLPTPPGAPTPTPPTMLDRPEGRPRLLP